MACGGLWPVWMGCALRGWWGWVCLACGGGPLRGVCPLPAPSRNRGSAPDPAPQTPEGLRGRDRARRPGVAGWAVGGRGARDGPGGCAGWSGRGVGEGVGGWRGWSGCSWGRARGVGVLHRCFGLRHVACVGGRAGPRRGPGWTGRACKGAGVDRPGLGTQVAGGGLERVEVWECSGAPRRSGRAGRVGAEGQIRIAGVDRGQRGWGGLRRGWGKPVCSGKRCGSQCGHGRPGWGLGFGVAGGRGGSCGGLWDPGSCGGGALFGWAAWVSAPGAETAWSAGAWSGLTVGVALFFRWLILRVRLEVGPDGIVAVNPWGHPSPGSGCGDFGAARCVGSGVPSRERLQDHGSCAERAGCGNLAGPAFRGAAGCSGVGPAFSSRRRLRRRQSGAGREAGAPGPRQRSEKPLGLECDARPPQEGLGAGLEGLEVVGRGLMG